MFRRSAFCVLGSILGWGTKILHPEQGEGWRQDISERYVLNSPVVFASFDGEGGDRSRNVDTVLCWKGGGNQILSPISS